MLAAELLALVAVAHGEEPGVEAAPAPWWERHAEGWFWYRDPPPPAPKPRPKPPPPERPAGGGAAPAPAPAGPPPLSAAWLKVHLPRYLNRALDEPTPENVRLYLYLQRVALNKAARFADAAQLVVLGDPALDEYAAYPTGTSLGQALMQEAARRREALLRDLARRAGLFFVYQGRCPACALQLQVLDTLARLHGFTVLPVSLDGSPPPGQPGRAFRRDRGQAARWGIRTGPAVVLARPPREAVVVARGLLPVQDLADRVLAVAAARGWVDRAAYEAARPAWRVPPPDEDLPEALRERLAQLEQMEIRP